MSIDADGNINNDALFNESIEVFEYKGYNGFYDNRTTQLYRMTQHKKSKQIDSVFPSLNPD